jgi:hypothetical protein
MPIDSATAVLERAGFVCESVSKKPVKVVDAKGKVTQGVFDFVKCEREDGSPPVKRRWEVTLVRENGLLVLIGLRSAIVYPEAPK